MPARKHVVVIGAGVGGLTAAARLQRAGFAVTVIEKNARVGGRVDVRELSGYRWDTGPTLLLMTDVYRELFSSLGRDLADYLTLQRLDPVYRINFAGGSSLDMTGRLDLLAAQVERFEAGATPALLRFLGDAGRKYRIGRREFVERNFEHARDFFSPSSLYYLLRTGAVNNYMRHLRRYFADPRLLQAFSLQTIYLGLSPYHSPAIYTLLPYAELVEDGVWFPRGGMYALAAALQRLATEEGAQIRTGSAVERIVRRDGRVQGVATGTGFVAADVVLANADLPYVYRRLLSRPPRRDLGFRPVDRLTYTCSAYMLYLGVRRRYDHLLHHNYFLSNDYRRTLDQIFVERRLPDDPAMYVCAPSISDPSFAPPGCSSLMALVPVPADSPHLHWQQERSAFKARVLNLLETRAGLTGLRDDIDVYWERGPSDWQEAYNLHRGAAFGLAHGILQVGYFRPDNRSHVLDNLYFVGASTRPGTGVPLTMIGARLVSERIVREQLS